jgi:hypothetical protein
MRNVDWTLKGQQTMNAVQSILDEILTTLIVCTGRVTRQPLTHKTGFRIVLSQILTNKENKKWDRLSPLDVGTCQN